MPRGAEALGGHITGAKQCPPPPAVNLVILLLTHWLALVLVCICHLLLLRENTVTTNGTMTESFRSVS